MVLFFVGLSVYVIHDDNECNDKLEQEIRQFAHGRQYICVHEGSYLTCSVGQDGQLIRTYCYVNSRFHGCYHQRAW